ncbi:MAG TPA: hypothetical protein VGX76_22035 [Pirellulales bacterium]|nr:hypothetical protein [Pirellulales bacterium]
MRAGLLGWVVVAAAGCCAQHTTRATSTGGRSLAELFEPTAPRGFEFDDRDVGELAQVDGALGMHDRPGYRYFALTDPECQCRAAASSTQGNSLASERRSIEATADKHKGLSESDQLKIRVLRASELEARNKSAGAALEIYYHLAEALAGAYVLDDSTREIDAALAKVDQMRGQGLVIPFDEGELRRQRLELVRKQVELDLQTSQLNAQLVRLLGLPDTDPALRFWPTTDWKVAVEPIDISLAVAEGLALRPEMRLLASLPASLNENTVSVVKLVLSGSSGLLGTQPKITGMISLFGVRELWSHARDNKRELPLRRRQLAEYTEQRRQEVTTEIQLAVLTVEARLREIATTRQVSREWERRIEELPKRQEIGGATFVDLSAAKLKAFQADSDEVGRIVAWKIALAKLKEAQGKLIDECLGVCFPK